MHIIRPSTRTEQEATIPEADLHLSSLQNIQDGLQAKQSVAPAEGSSAAGGAAAALLAMQASFNEHHVSDSFSFYCWWKLHITCTIAAFTVTATAAALLPQLHNSLPLCHSFRRYAAKNDPSAA